MALFENVNYEYYTEILKRHEVPNAEEFDKYALENKLFITKLIYDCVLIEPEEGAADKACCMMIEEDYKASQIAAGNNAAITSESIGGYSYSTSAKSADLQVEKDAKSTAAKKYKWLALYCELYAGVC